MTTYRGKVHVDEGAKRSKSFVRCDALLLDETVGVGDQALHGGRRSATPGSVTRPPSRRSVTTSSST